MLQGPGDRGRLGRDRRVAMRRPCAASTSGAARSFSWPRRRRRWSASSTSPTSMTARSGSLRRSLRATAGTTSRCPATRRRFLLGYSDPAQPPQISLHDSSGERVAWLVENRIDASHPYAPYLDRHVLPEFGTITRERRHRPPLPALQAGGLRGRASATPRCCSSTAARTVQTVQRRWGERRGSQTRSFSRSAAIVVFAIDNRGSGGRGRKFTEALYRRLGGVEVEDQLARRRLAQVAGIRGPGARRRLRLELRRLHDAHAARPVAGHVQGGRRRRAGHRLARSTTRTTRSVTSARRPTTRRAIASPTC